MYSPFTFLKTYYIYPNYSVLHNAKIVTAQNPLEIASQLEFTIFSAEQLYTIFIVYNY